jgi:hypothetical protein
MIPYSGDVGRMVPRATRDVHGVKGIGKILGDPDQREMGSATLVMLSAFSAA